jgi:hypothetical protein
MTIRTLVSVAQALGLRVGVELRPIHGDAKHAHATPESTTGAPVPLPDHAP